MTYQAPKQGAFFLVLLQPKNPHQSTANTASTDCKAH